MSGRLRARSHLRVSVQALSLAALLSTFPAAAQTDEARAGARAAATAGGKAFMDRKWSEAIDMFSRAESLVHSPVHLLYMARSYEKLNSLVKARETYIRITNEELPAGASQPMREAKISAEKELEALEPRVPSVTVTVQGAGPRAVTVTMDGVAVPQALIGVPRPVDPGDHRFEAVADGTSSGVTTLVVREGHAESVVLNMAAAQPVVGGPVPAPVGAAPGSQPVTAPPPPAAPTEPAPISTSASSSDLPMDSGGKKPSVVPWIVMGVGAVGVGAGAYFALQSKSDIDSAKNECADGADGVTLCSPKGKSLYDDAKTERTISIVGFAAGGVALAAGVTLLIIGGKKETASTTHVEPMIGLGSAGLRGSF